MSARVTEAREKLKLWFFRDMNDETRLKLFSLFGLSTDEIGKTHGHQSIALRHVLAAISTEPGEAEGMVLVPLHPTPEMLGAWYRYKSGFHYHDEPPPPDTSDVGAYAAMLAAAPLPEDTHHGR